MSGLISMAIYDDHLEIINPGRLPFGLTPDCLVKAHRSKPWNPFVAKAFYLSGISERWGMGTIKILEKCKKAGMKTPAWSVADDSPVSLEIESRAFKTEEKRLETESDLGIRNKVLLILSEGPKSKSDIGA